MSSSMKSSHPDLPTNKSASQRRLDSLVKRLKRNKNYQQYDEIIQDQLKQRTLEHAP